MLSCVFFIGAAIVAVGLAQALSYTKYSARILPVAPFAGLLLALFLGHIYGALAAPLRSYRREPLMWVAATGAVTTLVLVLPAARAAAADGIVAVMLAVQLVIVLPISLLIYRRLNRKWRAA
jgi:hypothetical protein